MKIHFDMFQEVSILGRGAIHAVYIQYRSAVLQTNNKNRRREFNYITFNSILN